MVEQIALANALLDLLERIANIGKRGIIPPSMMDDARRIILDALTTIFPPLPPE